MAAKLIKGLTLAVLIIAAVGALAINLVKPTTMDGIVYDLNPMAETDIVQTVKVNPANGRDIVIQRWSEAEEEWVDAGAVEMPDEKEASVEVKFPDDWKTLAFSKWRFVINRSFTAKEYESEPITVTTGNIAEIKKLKAKAAIVMCVTDGNKILFDLNANEQLPNASTTKLMTAMVSMDKLAGDEEIKFSQKAVETPDGNMWVEKGDKFTAEDLWNTLLIQSSNDASVAIAEGTSGSVKKFVKAMNAKAKELGCENTHFKNPHGLDTDGHYSSCYDLALIDIAAMKYDKIREILLKEKYEFTSTNHPERENYADTTNDLILEGYKGHLGGKTGWDTLSGGCFVGMYEYGGKQYVTVVLGSDKRFTDTKRLYKYIRDYYSGGEAPGKVGIQPDTGETEEEVEIFDIEDLGGSSEEEEEDDEDLSDAA